VGARIRNSQKRSQHFKKNIGNPQETGRNATWRNRTSGNVADAALFGGVSSHASYFNSETNQQENPMSFQKRSASAKKTHGDAAKKRRVVSLIGLAGNLQDPLYHRAVGELSVILEELKSINATRTQPLRGSRALGRYIE